MYTPEMEKAVRDAEPLDLAKAKEVASKIGMTYRSVIAKAKQLGVEYIAQPAPARKPKLPTKAERVEALEARFGVKLEGLEKAPASVLTQLEKVAPVELTDEQILETVEGL